MRIVTDNKGYKYIDKDLRDFINNIWLSFDIEIQPDSRIYFLKNTTVNRIITDYSNTDIRRCIKKEKADYVVLKRFQVSDYPYYYDNSNNTITSDDTKEVVYAIYNNDLFDKEAIENILEFISINPKIKFANQDKLNDSLNTGLIINKDNYLNFKELIDSQYEADNKLAFEMISRSSLRDNLDWILVLYCQKSQKFFNYDTKSEKYEYFKTLNLGYDVKSLFGSLDQLIKIVKDVDARECLLEHIKQLFNNGIQKYIAGLGVSLVQLDDFKLRLNDTE